MLPKVAAGAGRLAGRQGGLKIKAICFGLGSTHLAAGCSGPAASYVKACHHFIAVAIAAHGIARVKYLMYNKQKVC